MPIVSSTTGKTSSPAAGRRVPSGTKGGSRSNRSQRERTAQSLRISHTIQPSETAVNVYETKNEMSRSLLAPPRPPDPTLFIRAGTSGVRHLFPVHLTNNDQSNSNTCFSRPISHLRSHTPTTEMCTNVEMIRNICISVKTLRNFDVSENELSDLPLDICLLADLDTLNCSHNRLTNISDLFEQLKHLTELDLSFNLFQTLPNVVYTYKSLVRLNCEHNLITSINVDILNLKRLKFLVFDHNELETLESIDFGQMKKLEYIHIAHNQLNRFPRGLHHLHHLKNVNLSHNRLTAVPVDLLLVHTLDVLNLSHNLIIKLPPMPVAHTRATMIFSIDLSYNQLSKFYDYLLLIALKVDVSNNKIRQITNDMMRKLNDDVITSRELKIYNNPLAQPVLPIDVLNESSPSTVNILRVIKSCFDDQQADAIVRQGFKICIIGPKSSGKTSLTNCLEENLPLNVDDSNQEAQERIVHVHHFQFRLPINNDQPSILKVLTPTPSLTQSLTKSTITSSSKAVETPRTQSKRTENDPRKRKTSAAQLFKAPPSTFSQPSSPAPASSIVSSTSSTSWETGKSLPLTIFDFNGSPYYYEHMSGFIDTTALYILCIHSAEFHKTTPAYIEDIFNGKFNVSPTNTVTQLLSLLQILLEKATKTRGVMILPIATFIDLYDQRTSKEKNEVLTRINQFFKYYLQYRTDRIQKDIDSIHALQTISPSLSDRLKTYTAILSVNIQIEPCQAVSSLTFQGIDELNRTIQRCVFSNKIVFPHVDRLIPTLWADASQYVESLADTLLAPYLLWNKYAERVTNRHGLPHLLNDITKSLYDEGKICIQNELGTTDRLVFLRPSWLTDLLYNLFRQDLSTTYLDYDKNEIFSLSNIPESRFQTYKKEFLQYGLLHSDLLRALWCDLLHKKENFYQLWLTLMRFLLVAYPKMNKAQLKRLVRAPTPDPSSHDDEYPSRLTHVKQNPQDSEEIKFDYAIVPYYLPTVNRVEQEDEIKRFHNRFKNIIVIRYTSHSLPLGFFHRFSVSTILRLNCIYKKHWNNFILGEHEEKDVKFIMETDHRTYIICHCGSNLNEKSFEDIWNVLMSILNHIEEMFTTLAPGNRFDRSVRCPFCNEYSFMGEWTTPKELQCTKTRACSLCGENVDTSRLVQPNESKRRSEELLKRIRERHMKNANQGSDDIPATPSHLLISPA